MTLNEYNYLQSRFSRKLKKPDYTSKNAGYNAGISECRSIIEVEYNRMVEKEDQMDLPEYVCLQDRFSHALKNPAHTNRESSYNAANFSYKNISLLKNDIYEISVLGRRVVLCEDETYTLVEDGGHVYFY